MICGIIAVMKIATWNVNSLNVRLPQVLDWLAVAAPEVLCLQETKMEDAKFPLEACLAAGYQAIYSGQKTYNGVAILSRKPMTEVQAGIPGFADEQKRVLAATVDGIRIICVYVPNGQTVDSDKYQYKLRWLQALHAWLASELARYPRLVISGDYNIAPADADCYDPDAWYEQVLCSTPERQAFLRLLALGLSDCFRHFAQPEKSYSWWDYRQGGFRRNLGLRIDHILASTALTKDCQSCHIDPAPRRNERPSDHAPVLATFC
jgi:exodeoxyribonuclease-3